MSEEQKPQRPRTIPKTGSLLPIEDELAFTSNKCSKNARKIKSLKSGFGFEMWHEKHYAIRMQFGDNDGIRKGIDAHNIESLIIRSLRHIMAYSAILKTFAPINCESKMDRAERIVLQEESDDGMLNVVVEIHLISPEMFEITVITAICKEDYVLSDGQFGIEMIDNESVIRQMVRGAVKEIHNL